MYTSNNFETPRYPFYINENDHTNDIFELPPPRCPINNQRDHIIELLDNKEYDEISNMLPKKGRFIRWDPDETPNTGFSLFDKIKTVPVKMSVLEEISQDLAEYAVGKNDIEMFKKLVICNEGKDIFYTNYIIKNIVEKDDGTMCKIILSETKLRNKNVEFFLSYIVLYQKISLLNIFSEYGYKLHSYHLFLAIRRNYLDVIKYALEQNLDMQSAFDEHPFTDSVFTTDECRNILETREFDFDINMLKLLIENNINITSQINDIALMSITRDRIEIVKYLIENNYKCDINYLLNHSCFCNKKDTMIYLLQNDADINVIANISVMPNIEIIKLLIDNNYSISVDRLNIIFPVLFIKSGNFEDILWLINYGANPKSIFDRELGGHKHFYDKNNRYARNHTAQRNKQYEFFDSYLELCVVTRKISHIKYLAENYLDEMNLELNRLLIIASANGHVDLFEYFTDLGADIYSFDNLALRSACYFGQTNIIKLFLEKEYDLDINENLFEIVAHGLHDRYMNFNMPDTGYYSTLIGTTDIFRNDMFTHGEGDIFTLFIEHNIKPPTVDIYKILPDSHWNNELLMYMISYGIDINSNITAEKYKRRGGDINKLFTILDYAIIHNNAIMTRLLLENGADYLSNDKNAIRIANNYKCNNDEIKKILEEYGADMTLNMNCSKIAHGEYMPCEINW